MFDYPSRQKEYEELAAWPHKRYFTEKEYDNLREQAIKQFERDTKDGRSGYCNISDYIYHRLTQAAMDANAGEWYRAWFDKDIFNSWEHTVKYYNERVYWVNRAIACGIAKTAEEAESYFKEHK